MSAFNQITIPTRSFDYFIEITEMPVSRTLVLWYQPDLTPVSDAVVVPLTEWFDKTEKGDFIDLYKAPVLHFNKQNVSSIPELLSLAFARIARYVDEQIKLKDEWDEYLSEYL